MKIGQFQPGLVGLWKSGVQVGLVVSYVSGSRNKEYWSLTVASGYALPIDMDGILCQSSSTPYPPNWDVADLKKLSDTVFGAGNYKDYEVTTSWKPA